MVIGGDELLSMRAFSNLLEAVHIIARTSEVRKWVGPHPPHWHDGTMVLLPSSSSYGSSIVVVIEGVWKASCMGRVRTGVDDSV